MKELPSVLELENLLANQESLVNQVAGLQIKQQEEALFTGRGKSQSNPNSKRQQKSSQIWKEGSDSEKVEETGLLPLWQDWPLHKGLQSQVGR